MLLGFLVKLQQTLSLTVAISIFNIRLQHAFVILVSNDVSKNMKFSIDIFGAYPVLQGLSEQQFINAIEPRLIDIRNPNTGLQIDLFGRVPAVDLSRFNPQSGGIVTALVEIDDSVLERYQLSAAQLQPVLIARTSKLRHPATGVMSPVTAQLSN